MTKIGDARAGNEPHIPGADHCNGASFLPPDPPRHAQAIVFKPTGYVSHSAGM